MATNNIQQLCPDQLFTGSCTTSQCPLRHDARFCELCVVVCCPAYMYSSHVSGKYHRAKVAKGSDITILCPICNTRLAGEATWLQHINSTDHCSKAQATGKSASVYPRDPSTPSANFCLICKRSVPISVWTTHLRGVVHQRLQQNAQYRSQYEQAELGQHGVAISNGDGGLDLGVVSVEDAKKGLQRQLTITLDASAPAMSITGVTIFPSVVNKATSYVFPFTALLFLLASYTTRFSASTPKLGKTLVAGTSKNVHVIFRQEHRGRFQDRLEVTFKILSTERTFLISRSLRAVVGNAADHELLRPAAPYVRRGRAPWKHGEVVGEGDRPPALDAVQWAKPLPPSLIPSNLADILSDGNIRDVLNQVRAKFLPEFLNATHGQWFRVLLWVEESRMVYVASLIYAPET